MLTFGSLFSGVGGLDLGFERAGLKCVWHVEKDEFCRKVLRKHWPDVPQWDDVTTFTGEGFERPDVIAGGFPCQDLSLAGKRGGLEGERSGLWWEFARIIRILRPRYVVIENVPGIAIPVGPGRPAPLGCVLGELAKLGFDAEWSTVSARSVGSTQLRRRVFVIAYLRATEVDQGGYHQDTSGNKTLTLKGLVKSLEGTPTLTARDFRDGRHSEETWAKGGRPLNEYVQRLETTPTLTASNATCGPESLKSRSQRETAGGAKLIDLAAHLSGRGGGVLNPKWAGWYMGFPEDWCEIPSETSETP